ncbi:putative endonuclease [Anaerosolibacter carboniphilus]|uniref:UPF0102 protein HNQ80_003915 n=1 Tax=Anaerosolibacter carboniphilus TaxID=1417629 RepID=A0A841L3T9_9FIRM|nr:YraN family protein [Anaerosolibacter carboniphilus]MBB6217792.1 putative endonuclease [Anaerosolibacter carboniphilus]
MKGYNREIGIQGENAAIRYLVNQGYVVIERNYRSRYGEIDIIAKDNNMIVFVEVKTRSNLAYGRPAEAIDYRKTRHLRYTAQQYIQWKGLYDCGCRFDAIEVVIGSLNTRSKINHIRNIIE